MNDNMTFEESLIQAIKMTNPDINEIFKGQSDKWLEFSCSVCYHHTDKSFTIMNLSLETP
jgi:hypothetical protein